MAKLLNRNFTVRCPDATRRASSITIRALEQLFYVNSTKTEIKLVQEVMTKYGLGDSWCVYIYTYICIYRYM